MAAAPGEPEADASPQQPRLLWAGTGCLLDESSPTARWALTLLQGLAQSGWPVFALGATVFDDLAGMTPLLSHWPRLRSHLHGVCQVRHAGLLHHLHVVEATHRHAISHVEEGALFHLFLQALSSQHPEMLMIGGDETFDWVLAEEAREQGVAVVALCVDAARRRSNRWAWDVDLVLTPDPATAQDCRERLGVMAEAVESFVLQATGSAAGETRLQTLLKAVLQRRDRTRSLSTGLRPPVLG